MALALIFLGLKEKWSKTTATEVVIRVKLLRFYSCAIAISDSLICGVGWEEIARNDMHNKTTLNDPSYRLLLVI